MSSEIIQTLEALLSLGIAFLCVRLSKYRYQENEKYAVKYENNAKMLIIRWIITEIFKWGSILMLIGIIIKELSIFLALYILIPLLIALHMIFFNSDYLKGVMTFTKGIYYVGLTNSSFFYNCKCCWTCIRLYVITSNIWKHNSFRWWLQKYEEIKINDDFYFISS